ncbi:hypothetical protein BKA64DRAFT_640092 [Cadophora sp. MPI-SDFR-AT-0126]|nr:hypothetical protein BKA64DRAFT_640092 [Leotiomycetes sp. MPI-SDFR-AT-0126]
MQVEQASKQASFQALQRGPLTVKACLWAGLSFHPALFRHPATALEKAGNLELCFARKHVFSPQDHRTICQPKEKDELASIAVTQETKIDGGGNYPSVAESSVKSQGKTLNPTSKKPRNLGRDHLIPVHDATSPTPPIGPSSFFTSHNISPEPTNDMGAGEKHPTVEERGKYERITNWNGASEIDRSCDQYGICMDGDCRNVHYGRDLWLRRLIGVVAVLIGRQRARLDE